MWTVSVVIPARNDAAALGAAVRTVLAQEGVTIADIAIAVGPSSDGTEAEAWRLAQLDATITVVDNPTGRTPAGLNAAIAQTTGDVVVRVDARSQLPTDYIQNALETMNATGAGNVGAIQHPVGETATERAIAAAMHSKVGSGGAHYRHGGERRQVETAYLGVFQREALDQVGGYDENFIRNQDSELNVRLRKAGHEVWLDPRLVVDYRPRPSLKMLAKQYGQYGWWRAITLKRHPDSLKLRQAAVPVAVLLLSASLVLGVAVQPWLLVLPAAYLFALMVTAARETTELSLRERATMMAALVIMHWVWGASFIVSAVGHLFRRSRP